MGGPGTKLAPGHRTGLTLRLSAPQYLAQSCPVLLPEIFFNGKSERQGIPSYTRAVIVRQTSSSGGRVVLPTDLWR